MWAEPGLNLERDPRANSAEHSVVAKVELRSRSSVATSAKAIVPKTTCPTSEMQTEYMLGAQYHNPSYLNGRNGMTNMVRNSCQRRGYVAYNDAMPSISPIQEQILENDVKDLCPNPCEISQWASAPAAKYPNADGGEYKNISCFLNMLNSGGDALVSSGLDNTSAEYHTTLEYTGRSWEGVHPSEWNSSQVIEWLFHVFRQEYENVPIGNFRPVSGKVLVQMEKSDLLKLLHEEYAERVWTELRQLLMQFEYMHSNQYSMLSNNMYTSSYDSCPSDFTHIPYPMNEVYQTDFNQRTYNPSCQQFAVEQWFTTSRSVDIESDGESGHSTFTSSPYEMQSKLAVTDDPQKPHRRGPGRPPREGKKNKKNGQRNSRLWEFIRDLLKDKETCPRLVKWEDRSEGVFRFVQSDQVAKLWGERKANPRMTYEKLSRAMRYYYKSKVLQPVLGRRLVYKFGPCATGWRPHEA